MNKVKVCKRCKRRRLLKYFYIASSELIFVPTCYCCECLGFCFKCGGLLNCKKCSVCKTPLDIYIDKLEIICNDNKNGFLLFGKNVYNEMSRQSRNYLLSHVLFDEVECMNILTWMDENGSEEYEPINFENELILDR